VKHILDLLEEQCVAIPPHFHPPFDAAERTRPDLRVVQLGAHQIAQRAKYLDHVDFAREVLVLEVARHIGEAEPVWHQFAHEIKAAAGQDVFPVVGLA
jgi:hypothetical protein